LTPSEKRVEHREGVTEKLSAKKKRRGRKKRTEGPVVNHEGSRGGMGRRRKTLSLLKGGTGGGDVPWKTTIIGNETTLPVGEKNSRGKNKSRRHGGERGRVWSKGRGENRDSL